ncbi:ribokinase [Lichenicoccus sp.]|uniref:ribokinase n=1 Tax=Lichenicoccus sp. TaxID=2781899 RepID=UPI003D1033B8
MGASVVVVGSLHYDIIVSSSRLPRIGETLPGESWRAKCGGKGGNQAVEAARHGAATSMIACVGDDDFGRRLLDNLVAAGVDRGHVRVVAAGSGLSVVVSEAAGDYAAVIVSGSNESLGEHDVAGAQALIGEASVVILQNEIPDATNLAAARRARQAGALVILNAAPARVLCDELAACLDILVVNAIEAQMLGAAPVTDPTSAARAASHLSDLVPVVIVTAGGAGVAVQSVAYTGAVSPHAVQLVSTHGAGDAFIGALGARLAAGEGLEHAVAYANAAAALIVSTREEQRPGLTVEGVHRLLDRASA